MGSIEIKIQSKEDGLKGEANFPELGARATRRYQMAVEKVSILEAGTKAGRVSVGLIAEAEDGAVIVLDLTNDQLQAIAAAAKGAQARFDGICYKSNVKCKYGCKGLCKDSM